MTDTTKGKEFYIDMAKSVLNFNERFGINAAADFLKTFDELSALNDTVVAEPDWDKFICDAGLAMYPFNVDNIQFKGSRVKELLSLLYKQKNDTVVEDNEKLVALLRDCATPTVTDKPVDTGKGMPRHWWK